jgi:hypothetical protein
MGPVFVWALCPGYSTLQCIQYPRLHSLLNQYFKHLVSTLLEHRVNSVQNFLRVNSMRHFPVSTPCKIFVYAVNPQRHIHSASSPNKFCTHSGDPGIPPPPSPSRSPTHLPSPPQAASGSAVTLRRSPLYVTRRRLGYDACNHSTRPSSSHNIISLKIARRHHAYFHMGVPYML